MRERAVELGAVDLSNLVLAVVAENYKNSNATTMISPFVSIPPPSRNVVLTDRDVENAQMLDV